MLWSVMVQEMSVIKICVIVIYIFLSLVICLSIKAKTLYCSCDQCMAHVPCVVYCDSKSGTWLLLQMNQIYFLLKSSVFWDVTVCSPLKVNRCFGGTCHIHPQGWEVSQAGNKQKLTYINSLDSEVHHIFDLEKMAHGKDEAKHHWNNT
jgi:hypothetical protein